MTPVENNPTTQPSATAAHEDRLSLFTKRRWWLALFCLSYCLGFLITSYVANRTSTMGESFFEGLPISFAISPYIVFFAIISIPAQLFSNPLGRGFQNISSNLIPVGYLLIIPYILPFIRPSKISPTYRRVLLIVTTVISLLALKGCVTMDWHQGW